MIIGHIIPRPAQSIVQFLGIEPWDLKGRWVKPIRYCRICWRDIFPN